MVVQSNNDASQQQLYRQQDHTGEIILGTAALGGLAYLLSKGRKGIKGDVPKANEAVDGAVSTANQPIQLEKAVEAVNQLKAPDLKSAEYQNGQQFIVDNMLGQLGKETSVPLEDTVNSIKQKANLKNSIDSNVDASELGADFIIKDLESLKQIPEGLNRQIKDTYEQMLKDGQLNVHRIDGPDEYFDSIKNLETGLDKDTITQHIQSFGGARALSKNDKGDVFVDKQYLSNLGSNGEDVVNHEIGHIVSNRLFGDTHPGLGAKGAQDYSTDQLLSQEMMAWHAGGVISGKPIDMDNVDLSLVGYYRNTGKDTSSITEKEAYKTKMGAVKEASQRYSDYGGPKPETTAPVIEKPISREDIKTVNINDVLNDTKETASPPVNDSIENYRAGQREQRVKEMDYQSRTPEQIMKDKKRYDRIVEDTQIGSPYEAASEELVPIIHGGNSASIDAFFNKVHGDHTLQNMPHAEGQFISPQGKMWHSNKPSRAEMYATRTDAYTPDNPGEPAIAMGMIPRKYLYANNVGDEFSSSLWDSDKIQNVRVLKSSDQDFKNYEDIYKKDYLEPTKGAWNKAKEQELNRMVPGADKTFGQLGKEFGVDVDGYSPQYSADMLYDIMEASSR